MYVAIKAVLSKGLIICWWFLLASRHFLKTRKNVSLSFRSPSKTEGGFPSKFFPFDVGWVGPVTVAAIVDITAVTGGTLVGIDSPDVALVMISGSMTG